MELNKLYNIAEKENINIYNWNIENAYGAFININKLNTIVLNYDEFDTTLKEKETLAEELGHYYMNAIYPFYCSNKTLISKQEYRAKKWSYNTLIPFENLKLALLKRN